MPSNKDRLYIGLYARGGAPKMPGGEDKYHWALLTGPKVDNENVLGMRYHAREDIFDGTPEWRFEGVQARVIGSSRLLVRVVIAKVQDKEKLSEILQQVPINAGQPGWNCVIWVEEALGRLSEDTEALGRRVLDWDKVRDTAMGYCKRKHDEHYFDGTRDVDPKKTPTYDLVSDRELN
ncbi:hypothetical protein HD554DRAFT_2179963 [Boletus coccyginus]|nr:hypothetical protein HD554DRAFT_2179963 [Boletus coccyginus]